MASKFLKKIIAKDQQGLNTISAICSESKIKISDITKAIVKPYAKYNGT